MVKHIVLFKFKDGVDKSKEKEVLADKLKQLPSLINTIESLEVGKNQRDSQRSWDVSLIVIFKDWAGLEFYGPHPEHLKVIEYLNTCCEPVSVVDYEF